MSSSWRVLILEEGGDDLGIRGRRVQSEIFRESGLAVRHLAAAEKTEAQAAARLRCGGARLDRVAVERGGRDQVPRVAADSVKLTSGVKKITAPAPVFRQLAKQILSPAEIVEAGLIVEEKREMR